MSNTVWGKIYPYGLPSGNERVEQFEGTPCNMANFIMFHKDSSVVINDEDDNFVVSSTVGGFLDRVSYPALREELIKEILPLQMGDIAPFDPVVTTLARDLDDFAFDYDFYGYQDAVDDRTEHIQELIDDLETGNVIGLLDYLDEVMQADDGDFRHEAFELHRRVRKYYLKPIPVEWINAYLNKWCDKSELDKFRNFIEEMIEEWKRKA